MATRALPLSSSQSYCVNPLEKSLIVVSSNVKRVSNFNGVWAKLENTNEKEEPKKSKQSLFESVTEALDFSQVRSAEDAQLIEEARNATRSGGRMNREQYGALRRKIGGTYKDFFKSYVEVDGQYVEEGWVDKTCKVCKKIPEENPDGWIVLVDTSTWPVPIIPRHGISSPSFSPDSQKSLYSLLFVDFFSLHNIMERLND